MTLVISGFSLAWLPSVFRANVVGDAHARFSETAIWLSGILALMAVGLAAIAVELVAVVGGGSYAPAARAIPGLAAGMVAFGLYSLLAGASGLARRTADLAWTAGIGLLIQAVGAIVLVRIDPLFGAGLASFAGYLAAAVVLWARTGARAFVASSALAICVGAAAIGLGLESLLVFAGAPLPVRLGPLVLTAAALAFAFRRDPNRVAAGAGT
jgi:O-antigen/teichoic acid export membrane protein